MAYDYELFVIGGGSGGVRAANRTAALGHKVGIAEESRYGGTCVVRGCVPKKLYVYASTFHEHFEDAAGFGWSVGDISFDWQKLVTNKEAEITRDKRCNLFVVCGCGSSRVLSHLLKNKTTPRLPQIPVR